jgi:hypothetical protein
VDYCIDQANDWKNSKGDFSGDEPNENNTVTVEEISTMTVRDLALNLIEHADTTPEEIDVSRAAEIIGWLDPDSGLPEGLTPEALTDAWNDIVRTSAHEDNWS